MATLVKGYADIGSGQIHLRRVDGPGPPIVLLHRTPQDSSCFEALLERLAGRRAAIAFDTPGFGQSFRPPGSPSARDYGMWFLQALTALDVERFHLFGHHTGSHFAVEMADAAPERVLSLAINGVLYASAAERTVARANVRQAATIDPEGGYMARTWSVMRGLYEEFEPELIHSEVVGALTGRQAMPQVFGAIHSQDFPAALAKVRCPVCICQAVDDPLARYIDQIRAEHPQIPIDIHGPARLAAPERQPDALAALLIPFTATHDPRPAVA